MTTAHGIPPKPTSLEEFRRRRRPLRNVHKEVRENLGTLDRLAVWTTSRVGTMTFFLLILGWTIAWLGWNLLAPRSLRFDPPMGFVLWLFISNVIQILLMPLIMVGQNIQGAHAEARAEHDLDINVKAEKEIEVVLEHLEYQNTILMQMVAKLDIDVTEALHRPPAEVLAAAVGRAGRAGLRPVDRRADIAVGAADLLTLATWRGDELHDPAVSVGKASRPRLRRTPGRRGRGGGAPRRSGRSRRSSGPRRSARGRR